MIDPTSREIPWELTEALPEPGMRARGRGAEGHWTLVAGGVISYGIPIGVLWFVTSPWKWLILLVPFGAGAWRLLRPLNRSWRRAAADAIIETTLRFNRCPACGYTLEDLTRAEDGCVQCPECGAAWRADLTVTRGAEA